MTEYDRNIKKWRKKGNKKPLEHFFKNGTEASCANAIQYFSTSYLVCSFPQC